MATIPVWRRVLALPSEETGWWSAVLAVGVLVFYGLFRLAVERGHRGGPGFWDNPVLAVLAILMLGSGIAGGAMAVWSVAKKRDVSFLVWAAMAWGALWLVFTLGELSGTH